MKSIAVVVPNWNGDAILSDCLDSLLNQSVKAEIIVVENGSIDGSLELLEKKYPQVTTLVQKKNLGFAGGVNKGIELAIKQSYKYVALFNNDAVAEQNWLEELVQCLDANPNVGIATSKILDADGKHIDSTGDMYTIWGLPHPRGRGEPVSTKYDNDTDVFAGSGGASIYRISMLKEIGLFDEDFFAYYEDVDISFRAQLYGWKVSYVPSAVAYHQIGATGRKIKGFTTYHAMKNLQWLAFKNVPGKYLIQVLIPLRLALILFWARSVTRKQIWPATKGSWVAIIKLPKKLAERCVIQSHKKVSNEYIWGIMVHDLPPNAKALRSLRRKWYKLTGSKHANND